MQKERRERKANAVAAPASATTVKTEEDSETMKIIDGLEQSNNSN